MMQETLSVTFTYSNTQGVFTGVLPNGISFQFIATPDSPLPTKLRNVLLALMQRTHSAAHSYQPEETSDEEWEALALKIQSFEERHGVTRSLRKPKGTARAVRRTGINLDELDID